MYILVGNYTILILMCIIDENQKKKQKNKKKNVQDLKNIYFEPYARN